MSRQKFPMSSFDKVFDRICSLTGAKTQMELSHVIGVSQSSISDAKKRQTIPAEWFLKLLQVYRVNPEWIQSGTGSTFLVAADEPVAKAEQADVAKIEPSAAKTAVVAEAVEAAEAEPVPQLPPVAKKMVPERMPSKAEKPVFVFMKPEKSGYYWYQADATASPEILFYPTPRTTHLRGWFHGPLPVPVIPKEE